ncbi:MAG: Ger(x)C family spore germination protein [Oscillospiraceae bacterium]|nr:Ger(x)C family spore germination protein [Oscillospiraceae bacterium]
MELKKKWTLIFKNVANFIFVSTIFSAFLCLSGCTEKTQLSEKLMVQGIAVDFDEEKKEYNVFVQAFDFKNPEGKEQPGIKNLQTHGESVGNALESLSKIVGLEPLYSQNLVIIIGETAAKLGVEKFLDFFTRYHEHRLNVSIRASVGEAGKLLSMKVEGKPIKAANILALASKASDITALQFERDLKNYLSDPILLAMEATPYEKSVMCEKIAVFSQDKLMMFLDKDDTIATQILRGISNLGPLTVVNGEKKISCKLSKVKTKIEADGNNVYNININVSLSALEISENNEEIESLRSEIESKFENQISEMCKNVIYKITRSGCDVFKFGKILKNKKPSYFKNIENDWKNKIKNTEFKLKVKTNLAISGLSSR